MSFADKWFDTKGYKCFRADTPIKVMGVDGQLKDGEVFGATMGGSVLGPEAGDWKAGGFAFEVPFTVPPNDAVDYMAAGMDNGFVDDVATRFVILEFFTFAAYANAFTSQKYFCEIAQGGKWVCEAKSFHFQVWTENMKINTVLDCFFLCFVIYYCKKFVLDWHRNAKMEKSVVKFIFDPWNLLECINMIFYLIVYGYKFRWIATSAFNDDIAKMPSSIDYYPSKMDIEPRFR
jgi:hypothetical protein